jgi:multiple antibiotic resistance protein
MVWIPGSEFTMGTNAAIGWTDEKSAHRERRDWFVAGIKNDCSTRRQFQVSSDLCRNTSRRLLPVLSLVNPLICGAMFVRIEGTRSPSARLADATKASLAVLVILVLAALCGARVLQIFGVSLDAFSVAGGGVLSWIGFSMLRGKPTDLKVSTNPSTDNKAALTPLILFAASPGTITGVVTLAVAHSRLLFPITALVAVTVAAVVMWCSMLLVARMEGHARGGGFVRDTATRFMGLIVVAMGVQFTLTGIRAFMAGSA